MQPVIYKILRVIQTVYGLELCDESGSSCIIMHYSHIHICMRAQSGRGADGAIKLKS